MEGIKDSILKFLRLDSLIDSLSGYFEARIELVKLEVRDDIARVLSHALMIAVLLLLALLFIFFISFGVANYLNSRFNDSSSGYWIVADIYGLPCFFIYLFRKRLSHYFEKYLIVQTKKRKK
jgi:uncharacterized membrane protein YqjE